MLTGSGMKGRHSGSGGGGGTLQEKDRDTRRLALSEKLQISASTGVCRTKAG